MSSYVYFWTLGGLRAKKAWPGPVMSRRPFVQSRSRPSSLPMGGVAPSDLGSVQPLFQKDFSSPRTQIKIISAAVLSLRGALAIVTDAGRDAVDADVLRTNST